MNTHFPYENQSVFGWFPVPSRYACWVELVLIQMLTPNVSFVGHLAGILVGLLYTAGPLKALVDGMVAVLDVGAGGAQGYTPSAPPEESDEGFSSAWRGAFGGRGETTGGAARRRHFTEYTGGLSEEEQMRRAMEASRNARNGPNYGWRY